MDISGQKSQLSGAERRERFRISDTAILQVTEVEEAEVLAIPASEIVNSSGTFNLVNQLSAVDQDNKALLRSIGDQNPNLAAYLEGLNKKFDLVSSAVVETVLTDEHELQSIDISEGGIGFRHEQKLEIGKLFAIQIWFKQAQLGLTAYIKVVANNRTISRGHHISAAFVNLPDNEQSIISKHIMQLQLKQQRMAKAMNESQP